MIPGALEAVALAAVYRGFNFHHSRNHRPGLINHHRWCQFRIRHLDLTKEPNRRKKMDHHRKSKSTNVSPFVPGARSPSLGSCAAAPVATKSSAATTPGTAVEGRAIRVFTPVPCRASTRR